MKEPEMMDLVPRNPSRDLAMRLYGKILALGFVFVGEAHLYDLIDNVQDDYEELLRHFGFLGVKDE
jgi:hypothetical protein